MEKASLAELAQVITEEIYLLPEDREIEAETLEESQVSSPSNTSAPQPALSPEAEEASVESTTLEEPKKEMIQVKGSFNQRILVLHEEKTLAPEVLELLSKILAAVNHSMSDIGMVSSEAIAGRSMEDLLELNAHKIIKFGIIKHAVNAIPAPSYQVYADGETEYLFADALSSIAEDRALKGQLWKALQNLFNITK